MVELFDQYGTSLGVGQDVAVAVSDTIICRGVITEINQDEYRPWVICKLDWPNGCKVAHCCTSYGKRDGKYFMSQIIVL